MLISPIIPMMSMYKLPHGQYGYNGHVVNLPQNIATFIDSLPRHPTDLDIIVVRQQQSTQSHHDFRVRRSKILNALQWLISNNIYFRNITINNDNLASLPQDDNITGIHTVTISSEEPTNPEATQAEEPYTADLSRTFIPHVFEHRTEQQHIQQSLEQSISGNASTAIWPTRSNTPINEFNTQGYFTCAFPTLFPTGAGDFSAPRIHTVTIGNYFKHFLLYKDGRFAKHNRFRYFALNTEMRWRALQNGRVYIQQHVEDGLLSIDELRDMVGREGELFSNRVLRYAASLRGTRQYWFQQRSRLIAMVDDLGMPTIFFTHSAADFHWPDLARLFQNCTSNDFTQREAVADNPAIADWHFYNRVQKFVQCYYIEILGATDFWLRFEWQHRGSPHIHGLAWLANAPNVENVMALPNDQISEREQLINYIDSLICTSNPAILPDGSNAQHAPPPRFDPHPCGLNYKDIHNYQEDLANLVATCQRHTRCSPSYCLRIFQGEQSCRFGYPHPLQSSTIISIDNGQPELTTVRNDGLINSFNPIQLSAWRANVDMKFIVSRQRVIEYCAKYATKCEPRSQSLKDIFQGIVTSLKDGNTSLTAVQKLLINSVGQRDYSAQETCHILLQLPMYKSSRDFVVLTLDGSRVLQPDSDTQTATAPTILDHYIARPSTPSFDELTLLTFAKSYTMPKQLSGDVLRRRKDVVVIVRPYISPDPNGPNYEKYCLQKLMLYVSFRQISDLLTIHSTYAAAYSDFLLSENVPTSLEDDIHRLEESNTLEDEANEVSFTHASKCIVL